MAEYKLFPGDTPEVSTFEFHEHRERAPHLEQFHHQARLRQAADFVNKAAHLEGRLIQVSDLGCGDGGLLSVVQQFPAVEKAWGYDFQPSNQQGWRERGVTASLEDAISRVENPNVEYGHVTVTTEVLEHVADPHGVVRRISRNSLYLVASSPHNENDLAHDACHAWAWDMEGYRAMVESNGFDVLEHVMVDGMFQCLLARRKGYVSA